MFVIGATKANSLKEIRKIIPNHFLLIPGVGAQGGNAIEVCENGKNSNGGLLINSSRGIIYASSDKNFELIKSWKNLFEPYLIQSFERGGSGADISPLNNEKNVLAGLRPDSQRYFDYHHTSIDTFDAINKRELELGTFSMASLVYLFDKYGIIK